MHRVLIGTASAYLSGSSRFPPELTSLPWPELRELAWAEGLAPLMAYCRKLAGAEEEGTADEYRATFATNASYLALLEEVGTRFARLGLECVVLKGASLLATVYGDALGLRPMSDIDLLLRPGDLEAARRALQEVGFVPLSINAMCLMRDRHVIDLHTNPLSRLSPAFRYPLDSLWQRRRQLAGMPEAVRGLAPEDQFLQLAVHGLKHSFHRLIWLVDLALVYREIQPGRLDSAADEWNGRRVVAYGGYLLHDLFELPGPAGPRLNLVERRYLRAVKHRAQPSVGGKLVAAFSVPGWLGKLLYLGSLVVFDRHRGGDDRPISEEIGAVLRYRLARAAERVRAMARRWRRPPGESGAVLPGVSDRGTPDRRSRPGQ
ncbi:MAG: nucleotidyltransferase family protein [Armatimonadetes bacterium]|nr:nucleotidyltransferase family protein [Armatimonadota bacterium]